MATPAAPVDEATGKQLWIYTLIKLFNNFTIGIYQGKEALLISFC